jgi:ribonuclease T2
MQRTLLILLAASCITAPAQPPPRFDYYLLSLSWSPEHCATHPADKSPQCAGPRQYGFIVHGLWPNNLNGRHPQNCAGPRIDASRVSSDVREIMPSSDLVKHEWEKHGRCSGLSQDGYFQKVLAAWAAVAIPAEFRAPRTRVEFKPAELRARFAASNPAFLPAAFTVKSDGRFLQEIRVCLTKELASRACPNLGDIANRPLIVRPVR